MLLSCCYPAAILLLSCCYPAAILLLSCCYPAAILLLSCCYPAAILLLSCCYPAAILLLSCCYPEVHNLLSQLVHWWSTTQKKLILIVLLRSSSGNAPGGTPGALVWNQVVHLISHSTIGGTPIVVLLHWRSQCSISQQVYTCCDTKRSHFHCEFQCSWKLHWCEICSWKLQISQG